MELNIAISAVGITVAAPLEGIRKIKSDIGCGGFWTQVSYRIHTVTAADCCHGWYKSQLHVSTWIGYRIQLFDQTPGKMWGISKMGIISEIADLKKSWQSICEWVSPYLVRALSEKDWYPLSEWEFCFHAVLQHQVFSGFPACDLPCRIQHKCMSQLLKRNSLFLPFSSFLSLPSLLLSFPLFPPTLCLIGYVSLETPNEYSGPMREHHEKPLAFLRSEKWNHGTSERVMERTWRQQGEKCPPLITVVFQKWEVRSYPAACKGLWEILGPSAQESNWEHEGPAEVEILIYDAPIFRTGRPNMAGEGH